jgi:hypothetical protein
LSKELKRFKMLGIKWPNHHMAKGGVANHLQMAKGVATSTPKNQLKKKITEKPLGVPEQPLWPKGWLETSKWQKRVVVPTPKSFVNLIFLKIYIFYLINYVDMCQTVIGINVVFDGILTEESSLSLRKFWTKLSN